MTRSLQVRSGKWPLVGGIGWLSLSLVLQAVALSEPGPFGDTNATSNLASTGQVPNTWTSFRGPGANGHAARAKPPLNWSVSEGKNILWKTKVPKHGMSSPVIWEDRLFLTGADAQSRQIYCLETDTGKLLWQHDVNNVPGSPPDGKLPHVLDETGFAAPTATTNGRYVAAIFGTGELVCVNMKGERVWAKHLGIPENHYGHASSLICHGDLLFVQYDQTDNARLMAFALASGHPCLASQTRRHFVVFSHPH
jgi:outer membrane protein assembly factor BamB